MASHDFRIRPDRPTIASVSGNNPPSLSALTADQRENLLRRRSTPTGGPAMDIGTPAGGGPLLRRAGRIFGGMAVFLLSAWACSQFTASFRIALIVVGLMAAYMLIVGRITEGRADRVDR